MICPIENLSGPGKSIKREATDASEIAGLRRSGTARLRDAQNAALALESRFDLAYNAAHALSLAALRWHDFRSSQRYIVFQLLPDTLGLGPAVWRVLAKCHGMRNLSEYEGSSNIDERLVIDLLTACRQVETALASLLDGVASRD